MSKFALAATKGAGSQGNEERVARFVSSLTHSDNFTALLVLSHAPVSTTSWLAKVRIRRIHLARLPFTVVFLYPVPLSRSQMAQGVVGVALTVGIKALLSNLLNVQDDVSAPRVVNMYSTLSIFGGALLSYILWVVLSV